MGHTGRRGTSWRGFDPFPGRRRRRITGPYTSPIDGTRGAVRRSRYSPPDLGPGADGGEASRSRSEARDGERGQERTDEEQGEEEMVHLEGELGGKQRRREKEDEERDQRHGERLGRRTFQLGDLIGPTTAQAKLRPRAVTLL
jgi:hypothetical protein